MWSILHVVRCGYTTVRHCSRLCKRPPFHSLIHWNTRRATPCSQDGIKSRKSDPAKVQVTQIIFLHLRFLPMNEALSAEEWDPYLPFGIAHVVTNRMQMRRQAVLLPDNVCASDTVQSWLCAFVCAEHRWTFAELWDMTGTKKRPRHTNEQHGEFIRFIRSGKGQKGQKNSEMTFRFLSSVTCVCLRLLQLHHVPWMSLNKE